MFMVAPTTTVHLVLGLGIHVDLSLCAASVKGHFFYLLTPQSSYSAFSSVLHRVNSQQVTINFG